MVRKNVSSSSQQPSNQLVVVNPPISKAPKPKTGRKIEILRIKSSSSGQHYGRSSLEAERHILAPSSASRADRNLDKDSPPPSPQRDTTNKFTMEKPYPSDGQLRFAYAKDAELHKSLTKKGKWPIPLLFPVIEDLRKLEVLDAIRELVVSSGMNFVFREDPGSYHEATIEFISSFDPVYAPTMVGGNAEEGEVMCWRFCLGNLQWEVKADVLCDWLRLPRDGHIPMIVDEDIVSFWKRISGCVYTKDAQHKSTSIRIPKWNVVHKLLGGIVFVRTDYGRLVSKMEMAIMLMMGEGKKVDWLWCITNGIRGYQSLTSKNKGLGGGSFVAWIARKLNITFNDRRPDKLELDAKKMLHMRILGKGMTWANDGKEPGTASEEEELNIDEEIDGYVDPRAPSSSRSVPPPRDFSDPGLASLTSQFEILAREQRDHNAYVSRHFQWQEQHAHWNERTLLTMATHMGIASSIGPPPLPPMDPAADPTAGLSDFEGSL